MSHLLTRVARDAAGRTAALALRRRCFPGDAPDRHDDASDHLLVERDGRPVASLRLRLHDAASIPDGYAAESYDLAAMARRPGPFAEVGRFCVDPAARGDPDVLRAALGTLAAWAAAGGARVLFGCATFPGIDPAPHRAALALLAGHVAPQTWRAGARARETVALGGSPPDRATALRAMPPLLRAYLAMGAWTSDHAVVDRALGTVHVLVILDAARIPPARLRALGLAPAVG